MGLRGPCAMTELSAAQMLATWVTEHQRFPTWRECIAGNGIIHWDTVYKMFPGSCFSARISAALATPGVTVSLAPSSLKVRPCLGSKCQVSFLTTPEKRFCEACHKKRQALSQEQEDQEPALSRVSMRRFGAGVADWREDIAW